MSGTNGKIVVKANAGAVLLAGEKFQEKFSKLSPQAQDDHRRYIWNEIMKEGGYGKLNPEQIANLVHMREAVEKNLPRKANAEPMVERMVSC